MKVLVTGAKGFICGYAIEELLSAGYDVVGIDDQSKYGPVRKSYDHHARYRFVGGDAKDVHVLTELAMDCDQILAGAAMVGGIAYFHERAYDLLAENERIIAATFDAALAARRLGKLERIVVLSSSMVYEQAVILPTPEEAAGGSPPPRSTYGFQKLASEIFARGAWEQYRLPYTILRPFNCVGIGERRPVTVADALPGNVAQIRTHVVPDLVAKALAGQDPLHILGDGQQVRHYTYGGDLAIGIRLAMESPRAANEDFNLATAVGTTVQELATMIWERVRPGRPVRLAYDAPYPHDVPVRRPDVRKAADVLGFVARTPLSDVLDEIITWMRAGSPEPAA